MIYSPSEKRRELIDKPAADWSAIDIVAAKHLLGLDEADKLLALKEQHRHVEAMIDLARPRQTRTSLAAVGPAWRAV